MTLATAVNVVLLAELATALAVGALAALRWAARFPPAEIADALPAPEGSE